MFGDNVVCLDHGDNRLAYSKYNSYELGSNIQAVIHLLASNAAALWGCLPICVLFTSPSFLLASLQWWVSHITFDLQRVEPLEWMLHHSWTTSLGRYSEHHSSNLAITSDNGTLHPCQFPQPSRFTLSLHCNNAALWSGSSFSGPLTLTMTFTKLQQVLICPSFPKSIQCVVEVLHPLLLRWTGVISTSRLSAYSRDHSASSELIFQWVNEKVWVVPPGHLQTLMILVKNWLSFQLRWLQLVANCMRVSPGQSSFSSTSWWTWPVVQGAIPTMVPAQYWMSIQFQSQTGSVWHPHYPSLLVQPWLPPWRSSHCLKWFSSEVLSLQYNSWGFEGMFE